MIDLGKQIHISFHTFKINILKLNKKYINNLHTQEFISAVGWGDNSSTQ